MPNTHLIGDEIIYDNAQAHTAVLARHYLFEVGISVMEWPARSLDMNPIENLWDKLKRRIRGRDRASETLGQF